MLIFYAFVRHGTAEEYSTCEFTSFSYVLQHSKCLLYSSVMISTNNSVQQKRVHNFSGSYTCIILGLVDSQLLLVPYTAKTSYELRIIMVTAWTKMWSTGHYMSIPEWAHVCWWYSYCIWNNVSINHYKKLSDTLTASISSITLIIKPMSKLMTNNSTQCSIYQKPKQEP